MVILERGSAFSLNYSPLCRKWWGATPNETVIRVYLLHWHGSAYNPTALMC